MVSFLNVQWPKMDSPRVRQPFMPGIFLLNRRVWLIFKAACWINLDNSNKFMHTHAQCTLHFTLCPSSMRNLLLTSRTIHFITFHCATWHSRRLLSMPWYSIHILFLCQHGSFFFSLRKFLSIVFLPKWFHTRNPNWLFFSWSFYFAWNEKKFDNIKQKMPFNGKKS